MFTTDHIYQIVKDECDKIRGQANRAENFIITASQTVDTEAES